MQLAKKIIFWLIALTVFLVALLAAVDNQHEVALQFLDWSTPAVPFAWWILGAFVLGVLLAMVWNAWSNTRLRLAVRKANKQVEQARHEVDRVKAENRPIVERLDS